MSLWLGILGGQVTVLPNSTAIVVSARVVWQWSSSGFGTKYADPTPALGSGGAVRFSPTGAAVAFSGPGPNLFPARGPLDVRKWNNGFGTKFSNPATLAEGEALAFTPSGDTIMTARDGEEFNTFTATPYAYPWNDESGFGTKFSNPATLPFWRVFGADFSSNAVAFSSYRAEAYPWSSSGFGTKYAAPSSDLNSLAFDISFSPDGNQIARTNQFAPRMAAWPFASGFGTRYADPATLPSGNSYGLRFNRSGDVLAIGHFAGPRVSVYPWSSSGFGTKYADAATLPSVEGGGLSFDVRETAIAMAGRNAPGVQAYQWNNTSGFGTKYADPVTAGGENDQGATVDFSHN